MGLRIKSGDTVEVISGTYKGAIGKVLAIYPKKDQALVERVNLVKKHQKAQGQNKPAGIIEKEMPIHLSKLMLSDPKNHNRGTRFSNVMEGQRKVRKSKITGNEL